MLAALARPSWRGRTNVDAETIAAIEAAERLAGHEFVITQGSYQHGAGDPLSGGTHDGGGAIDVRWTGRVSDVLALRKVGFAAWHRTPAQGTWPHHIHAVLIGHPLLARSAANQVKSYLRGMNGLKYERPDDGPRVHPIPRFTYPPEDDMPAYSDWAKKDRDALASDVAAAILDAPIPNQNITGPGKTMTVRQVLSNIELDVDRHASDLSDQIKDGK